MSDFRYTPQAVSAIRRHARTMAPATIAALMHCPTDMVLSICKKHDIQLLDKDALMRDPEPPQPGRKIVRKDLTILIDDVMLRKVSRQARQRGVDTHTLIEMLIEKIAEDDHFGAVLDR